MNPAIKVSGRWTDREKLAFEHGLEKYGRGNWRLFLPLIRKYFLRFSSFFRPPVVALMRQKQYMSPKLTRPFRAAQTVPLTHARSHLVTFWGGAQFRLFFILFLSVLTPPPFSAPPPF